MSGFEPQSALWADFNREVTESFTSFKICMTEKNLKKRFVLRGKAIVLQVKLKNKLEGSSTRDKSFPLPDTYIVDSLEVSFSIASVIRRDDRI